MIDEIVAGRVNWKLHVRIIILARVPNPNNADEIVNIEMILMDEKVMSSTLITI